MGTQYARSSDYGARTRVRDSLVPRLRAALLERERVETAWDDRDELSRRLRIDRRRRDAG
jgi:hypothetical protein